MKTVVEPVIATNLVVHETPWTCWPVLGGCGHRIGLNFGGGPCPACGEYAVTRIALRSPEPERSAA